MTKVVVVLASYSDSETVTLPRDLWKAILEVAKLHHQPIEAVVDRHKALKFARALQEGLSVVGKDDCWPYSVFKNAEARMAIDRVIELSRLWQGLRIIERYKP